MRRQQSKECELTIGNNPPPKYPQPNRPNKPPINSKPFSQNSLYGNNNLNNSKKPPITTTTGSSAYKPKITSAQGTRNMSNPSSKNQSQYSANSKKTVSNLSNKPYLKKNSSQSGAQTDTPDDMQDQLAEVWKVFGRETEAGKALYRMYAAGHTKPIAYPDTISTKPWDPKEALKIDYKPCPQTTQIEYPEVFTKYQMERQKMMDNIHPIDLIRKRKNRDVIQQEQKNYYAVVDIPINKAVDREDMIEKLQNKFKFAKKKKYFILVY